jgi:tRNA A37 methylthiotransferase MiaB
MAPKIPTDVKKERSRILRDLDLDLQSRFRAQFLGETAQVLIESTNGAPSGRSERYFVVQLKNGTDRTYETNGTYENSVVTVRVEENMRDRVLGTVVT